ncbi:MAG: leucine-rich repeat protein, partial [Clostridia bacterium]|nr:leucine-rich repeat protein [Clostridia bacterium]
DNSDEKVAVCADYVGPTEGVTEVTIPGEINGIRVYCLMIANTLPDSVETVVVEEGVSMMIASFLQEPNLTHVELPDSLVHTFESFLNLPKLKEIDLPENLYWLGGFRNCESLTRVTVPASVGYLEAFGYCNLESVAIESESLYCVDYNSFRDNPNLTEVVLPDSVRTIGAGSFMNTGITEFHVPACLQEVGRFGDTNKTDLHERVLMNTPYMDSLEEDFLVWNDRLLVAYLGDDTSVTVPAGVTHLCNYAFNSETLEELIVPEGVEVFWRYALFNTPALKKLELPSTLTVFELSNDMRKALCDTCVVYLPADSVALEFLEQGKYPMQCEIK